MPEFPRGLVLTRLCALLPPPFSTWCLWELPWRIQAANAWPFIVGFTWFQASVTRLALVPNTLAGYSIQMVGTEGAPC